MRDETAQLKSSVPFWTLSGFALVGALFLGFTLLYRSAGAMWQLTCAITFGTTFYHFFIRFFSPVLLTLVFRRHYDPQGLWFRQHSWEPGLYRALRVKTWKRFTPTFDPRQFSLRLHSPEEIVTNMCHAELVHELIAALCLLSFFFAIPFGEAPVFVITGTLSCLIELPFVILQRYNRPRFQKLSARIK